MGKEIFFLITSILIFIITLNSVSAYTNVSDCGILDDAGIYVLNTSLNSGDSCLFINKSDIVLDCAGYDIVYGNATEIGFGIIINNLTALEWTPSNITIRNCNFIQNESSVNSTGVFFKADLEDSVLSNNTFTFSSNNSAGIVFSDNPQGTSIYDNTFIIEGNDNWAILVGDLSQNLSVYNNAFTSEGNSSIMIYIGPNSENCSIFENLLTLNSTGGDLSRTILIEEDSVEANVISNNITSRSISSEPSPGIDIGSRSTDFYIGGNRVDILGNESSGIRINDNSSSGVIYNNIINVSGNLNRRTNYGRGGIFLETGTYEMNVSSNEVYTYGINSTAIFVWGNESTIELNTISTSGENSPGISLQESEKMNITSNNITTLGSLSYGVYLTNSDEGNLFSNTVLTQDTYASSIYIQSSIGNNLSSNTLTVTGNLSAAIYLYDEANETFIYNNTLVAGGEHSAGIYFIGNPEYIYDCTIINNNIKAISSTNLPIYALGSLNNLFYNNIFNCSLPVTGAPFEILSQFYSTDNLTNSWNTTKTSGTNIVGKNYIGGNYWTTPEGDGYSDTCDDADGDYICDEPYEMTGNNTDYLPLTLTTSYEEDDDDDTTGGTTGGAATTFAWVATYFPTEEELSYENGYTRDLRDRSRIRVLFKGNNHYVGIVSLTDTNATINVSSKPQQAVFYIGDEKKFDVNNDGYYDIYVKLSGIRYSRASITVKLINQEVQGATTTNGEGGEDTEEGSEKEGTNKYLKYFIISLILIVLITLIILIYNYYRKKRYYHKGH
jgi:hypothetical protein